MKIYFFFLLIYYKVVENNTIVTEAKMIEEDHSLVEDNILEDKLVEVY